MKVVRSENIQVDGGTIPITISKDREEKVISIDGVEWVRTKNDMHTAVLFNMMLKHITDYVHYEIADDTPSMNLKEIMDKYSLSMREVSDMFGIPYRTVQNWVSGHRECPTYILRMIQKLLEQ